jgi:hypothetical protein
MVSFYDPETGIFTGRQFRGSSRTLAANTPSGMKALRGRYDHRTQRVDVETGQVVDYRPPPDPVENRNRARARIRALEAKQKRPLRELSIDPSNSEARSRLETIDAEIAILRGELL